MRGLRTAENVSGRAECAGRGVEPKDSREEVGVGAAAVDTLAAENARFVLKSPERLGASARLLSLI